jgi:hypothetical protein
MSAERVLAEIKGRGVTVVRVGDKLRYRPASALTPELLTAFRKHKEAILELLAKREARGNPDAREDGEDGDPADPVRLPNESVAVWIRRVREFRRRRRGGEGDEQRAPRRREPPAEPSVPPPARTDELDKPRLDRLAHRHTEKARFFRESMREVEERRRTGIYPPHIRPVATNGTKPPGENAS